jgi:hypothetical protein
MDVQSVAPSDGATAGGSPAPADVTPGAATQGGLQDQPISGAQPSGGSATLASTIARLYNVDAGPSSAPQDLDVSYRVVQSLDLVVTVLTNPVTGQEVAQIPPEVLIGLAELFDQTDGVTIDKKV